jgi:hypothetical protein
MAQASHLALVLKEMTTQESRVPALPWYEWMISSSYSKKSCPFAADSGLL